MIQGEKRTRTAEILLAVVLNIALVICVIYSVLSAFHNSKQVSFSQNIENIRTLTNASASKVELEMNHQMQEIEHIANYVNYYRGAGMTLDEMQTYFTAVYEPAEAFSWQLAAAGAVESETSKEGFSAISLCDRKADEFVYRARSYPELAKIFCQAKKDTMGIIRCTSEFTDASPMLEKSFALTTTVRVRTEAGYEYRTLMHLIESNYINQLISNNNDVDTWNFFDYSNIIVDDEGNYVISNSYFQGTNFTDYMALYNEKFTKEDARELCAKMKREDYSEVLYYQNNKEQDCAYSIVPVQNSNWHILSIVPLSSFHNTYDFTNDFAKFGFALAALFLVDIIVVLLVNKKLRQMTRKAREANESKSRFLSSMSHDIRTPMNAIIGMTAITEKQLEEEAIDRDAMKESIRTIELSGNHLLTLINDILDISQIESGVIMLHTTDFSIKDTLTEIVEMCQSQIEEKNFDFELQIEEVLHEYINGDPLRVNQIFVNILSNALKYTNPGGKIVVSLVEETVEGTDGRARYIYRVSDTGIGMTPEFVEQIFERFTRAVDTRVNAVQGTGLGMAIVNQLVSQMGGSIHVESQLNVGSVFTVILEFPVAERAEELRNKEKTARQNQELNEKELSLADMCVLVAEDNDINWKVLQRLLQFYQIHTERADNGKIAVDKVQNTEKLYDLVLMDIQMPVMNGYEATKAIRELEDTARSSVPIYAMTADTFMEDIKKCEEAGMNGHLPKPIDVEKILGVIREWRKKDEKMV